MKETIMIESRNILTAAAGKTGSRDAAHTLEAADSVRTMVYRDHGRSSQLKEKWRLMRFFVMAALFLFSLCPRAALAGEIKAYSPSEFDKLAAAGKPILLDFSADWCFTCAAQAPIIRELTAQSEYKDLTTFTIDFDRDTALLKAYNVSAQSTLIVLKGKQEAGRSVGDTSRKGIERLLNSVIH
jgi:thiol:disulfide interchange protein